MIVSIGELLCDFIAMNDKPLAMVEKFERHAGGAPANVAVGLSRLGIRSALISRVGMDPFGDFLVDAVSREGVKPSISRDPEKHTGVVFVQLQGATPDFILYDGVAYFNIKRDDVDTSVLEGAEVVHFGTVLFAREPSRTTLFDVLHDLKGRSLLSYDVNIRIDLWRGREEEMLEDIRRALSLADVVKLGIGEFDYLLKKGIDVRRFHPKLLAVTMGSEGAVMYSGDVKVSVGALRVEAVDTTGAGDAFMAGLLAGLEHSHMIGDLMDGRAINEKSLSALGRFGNLVAGLSTTRRGAWSAPSLDEIAMSREFLELTGS